MTGVALLGLGRAGSFHLASIRSLPGVRLARVYDVDRARAEKVAAETGCVAAASDAEAIGADDVDAVVIATPTQTHHGYVVAALEAGVPVLSEKPLGVDLDEIDQCFSLARDRGLPLLVAFQRRFDPSFAAAAAAVHAGEVGELQFIRSVSRDNPVPSIDYIKTSNGIFHDCIVHDFDLLCWIARETPEEVFAFGSNFLPDVKAIGDLDTVVVALRFASGLLASIDISRKSVYGYDQRLEVFGSRGMVQSENRPQTMAVRSGEDGISAPPIDYSFPTRYRDAYRLELECFLDCVRGGREVPITHEQVRAVHRLANAAEQSFREGRPVRVEPSPR
ncbi:MAG: Gfo/Idh/MocA family oxidoreductase [Proteobacteria bacterium]|nr:Gfo/Idh/MocA family oxidoreductase [Pseudomonadota bacterium]